VGATAPTAAGGAHPGRCPGAPGSAQAGQAVHHLASAGVVDGGIGRLPWVGARAGGIRARLGLLVRPARFGVSGARVAGRCGAGLRLAGRILAAQGTVITIIALLYAFIPSVSHAYWIFAAMATQVYLIMYVLMFIAAMKLRRAQPDHPRGYKAPALGVLCLLGGLSSVAALVIGFIPPAQFGHSNPLTYAALILAGILAIGIAPPLLLDRLRRPGWKAASSGPAPPP
jgi:Amino acid permease